MESFIKWGLGLFILYLQGSWMASKRCALILTTRLCVWCRHVWVRFNGRRLNYWFSVVASSLQILIFLSNCSWQVLSWAFPCTQVLRQNPLKNFWHQWALDLIHRQLVSFGKRWVKCKWKVLYKYYCSNQSIFIALVLWRWKNRRENAYRRKQVKSSLPYPVVSQIQHER